MPKISRKTARESGELFYVGRPCYRDHEPKRYAASGHCVQCSLNKGSEQYKREGAIAIKRASDRFKRIKGNDADYEAYVEARRPLQRGYKGIPEPTRPEPLDCECCGKPPDGRNHRLNVDHDHVTGKFRGWLCWSCNTAIGKLGDCASGVMKAVTYLDRSLKE